VGRRRGRSAWRRARRSDHLDRITATDFVPHVDVNKAVDRQDGASAAEQALQTVVGNAMAGNPPIVVEIVATEGHPQNFWQSSPGMLILSSWVLGGEAAWRAGCWVG
jgi:hypothetical protein